jgi:hypothetical protein
VAAFGDPEAVRVGVRLSADTSDGVKVDWFKGVQRFTRFAHADS